jgi:hypothetical protein
VAHVVGPVDEPHGGWLPASCLACCAAIYRMNV